MPVLNELISAILQLLLFSLIPFIYYVIRNRKVKGFLHWIGLFISKPVPIKAIILIFIGLSVVSFLPLYWVYTTGSLSFEGFVLDSYLESGWSFATVITILLYACIQTSLSEEIVFRGFIIRLFTPKFGSQTGNIIQATLFGLIHIFAVINAGFLASLVVFILTGGIGYALGWLSIKKSNDSIVYGWVIHAVVNIISSVIELIFLI